MAHQRAYTDDQKASVELLTEVARQYYERFMTQAEIAQNVGVSRSQVSRYLKAAHEEGIVQITIAAPAASDSELEQALKDRFRHLREVAVVPSTPTSAAGPVLSRVANAGARMLRSIVQPDDTISVGAGRTLAQLVSALEPKRQDGVVVVQAMGNVGHEAHEIDYNAIAQGVAAAFSGRVFQINAPAILSVPYLAEDMQRSHASIGNAVARARSADVFAIGLGTLASDTLFVSTGLLTESDIDEVGRQEPAGDICGRFYDRKGKAIATPFDDRIVGIRLEDLKKARAVLAVAAGAEKATPMLGALRGGYLTHVATDAVVARAVLDEAARRR